MEERIRERYSEAILDQALEACGIDKRTIQALDGFENYIYEFQGPAGPGVLRISHCIRRDPDWIQVDRLSLQSRSRCFPAPALCPG